MRIKQGNDIKVSVPVYRVNGEQSVAENMETAQNIVLLLCNNNFSSVVYKIEDYTVSGNRISFVAGKAMQEVLGKYLVELKYDQADAAQPDGLQTFSADKKDVFEIVRFTDETDMSQVGDVTVTSVEIVLGVQAGINGLSAYEIALSNGFVGTVSEWILSLKGEKGDKGDTGIQGLQGIKGGKGDTGAKGADGVQLGETSTTAYAGDKGKKNAEDLVQLGADLGDNIEPALAEIINHQNGRIKALEDLVKNMLFKAGQFDTIDIVKQLNVWGGTNFIIVGTAAPTIVPDFIGQWYINTSGVGTTYQSKGIASTSDWKQTSN